jgi:hypothetical protein
MTPEIRPRPRPNSRVAGLRSYRRAPLPPFVDLRLDGNEGPHPDAALWPPPDVRVLREYPDAGRVEAAYARSLGLADDRVAVFAGGDEVLDRVFRAFTEPGEAVAFTEPTFELIAHYARLAGVGYGERHVGSRRVPYSRSCVDSPDPRVASRSSCRRTTRPALPRRVPTSKPCSTASNSSCSTTPTSSSQTRI